MFDYISGFLSEIQQTAKHYKTNTCLYNITKQNMSCNIFQYTFVQVFSSKKKETFKYLWRVWLCLNTIVFSESRFILFVERYVLENISINLVYRCHRFLSKKTHRWLKHVTMLHPIRPFTLSQSHFFVCVYFTFPIATFVKTICRMSNNMCSHATRILEYFLIAFTPSKLPVHVSSERTAGKFHRFWPSIHIFITRGYLTSVMYKCDIFIVGRSWINEQCLKVMKGKRILSYIFNSEKLHSMLRDT